MKILEVIPSLYSGGAENFLVNLSNEIAKLQDCEVTILTLYPPKENEFLWHKINPKVKTIYLNKKRGIDIKMLFHILKIIRKGKFDIAHFHVQAIIYSLLSTIFYRKCKYFATIHNDAYKEAQGIHRWVRKILFNFKLCNAITISLDSQRSYKELYKQDSTLIYNGVPKYHKNKDIDINQYKLTNNTIIFVYVASIMKKKNQVVFAKCINRLAHEGFDISTIILGKKAVNYEEYYTQLKNEVSKNVHLIGEVDNPTDYMAKSDFFVLVSEYEGMPISLLEAFSTNCIPIVTPVGGCKNVVQDNINGFIAESPNEEDVYTALKRALEMKETDKKKMLAHIAKDATYFTIEYCAQLHVELFKKGRC